MQSLMQSSIRFLGSLFVLGSLFNVALAEVEVLPEPDVIASEQYYGQTLDVQVFDSPQGQFQGEVRMNNVPVEVTGAEFYMVSSPDKVLVLQESFPIRELTSLGDTKLVYGFDMDVSSKGLAGNYDLYVSFVDAFSNRVGVGKKQVEFEKGSQFASKLSNPLVEKSSVDGIGVASFTFNAGSNGLGVLPVIRLYENSLSGDLYGEYKGSISSVDAGGKRNFEIEFPWPNKPESYVLVVRAEDEDGIAHGGDIVERVIVEGEFAEIFGVTPQQDVTLSDAQDFLVSMKGYVPYGKAYDLNIGVVQSNKSDTVQEDSKSLKIESNTKALFEVNQSFGLDEEAETVLLKAQIVNPQTKEVIEEKQFEWQKSVVPASVKAAQERDSVTRDVDPIRLYVLGAILLILLLLVYLFARNKKHLSVFILLFGSIFFSSVHAADLETDLGVPYTVTMPALANTVFTNSNANGFEKVAVTGYIEAGQPGQEEGVFGIDYLDFNSVQVTLTDSASLSKNLLINGTDILVELSSPFSAGLPATPEVWNKFVIPLNLASPDFDDLTEGAVQLDLLFSFNGGNITILDSQPQLFTIDNTPPELSIETAAVDALAVRTAESELELTCEDLNCLTGESGLSGTTVPIEVKGNFCDGTDDTGKLCETDRDKQTFEVCDGAGYCTVRDLTQEILSGDLFYYDPFPPKLDSIKIARTEGANTTEWTRGLNASGGNIEANDEFAFELLEDTDAEFDTTDASNKVTIAGIDYPLAAQDWDDWKQGPAGDENACGETYYDPASDSFLPRDYDTSTAGIQKGPFFFGPADENKNGGISGTDETASKCRQRVVACTKGNGHRGIWDRELNPDYAEEHCIGTNDCADGYSFNGTSCDQILQCNPQQVSVIQDEVDNGRAWVSTNSNAGDENQAFTFNTSTSQVDTNACDWGCFGGLTLDPNTNRCIPDCKDGALPICMGAECFGTFCATPTPGNCGTADQATTPTPATVAPSDYDELCSSGFPTNVVKIGPSQWEWDCLGGQGATPGSSAPDNQCRTAQ